MSCDKPGKRDANDVWRKSGESGLLSAIESKVQVAGPGMPGSTPAPSAEAGTTLLKELAAAPSKAEGMGIIASVVGDPRKLDQVAAAWRLDRDGSSALLLVAQKVHGLAGPINTELRPRVKLRATEQERAASGAARAPSSAARDEPELSAVCDLPYTDLGNARRLVAWFGQDLRWCEARGKWLAWSGSHWSWDLTKEAHRRAQETVERITTHEAAHLGRIGAEGRAEAAQKHGLASQASARINAIREQAAALPGVAVTVDQLDANPLLLAAKNATIDLVTCDAREPKREDLITRALAVDFDPTADCPTWNQFLAQVLPDEDVRGLVQRIAGYCLTGDNSEQRWFLFQGTGSNGKNTLLDTLRHVLGPYATVLPAGVLEAQQFEKHSSELMGLLGARLAIGSEPRTGQKWDAERIKKLTGDGSITANWMRQDPIEFACTAKLIVSANDLPSTDDLGHGFWRRLVLVPFTVRVTPDKVNDKLPEQLKDEAAGILNWALAGLEAWRAGGLKIPEVCLAEAKQYRGEQDHVRRFVLEECERGDAFSETTDRLYQAYRQWHESEGINGELPSKVKFGKALTTRLGFKSGHARDGKYRSGLRLRGSGRQFSTNRSDG